MTTILAFKHSGTAEKTVRLASNKLMKVSSTWVTFEFDSICEQLNFRLKSAA